MQREADEMHDLLKEKNWYSKYVAKIAQEEEKRQAVIQNLIKSPKAESVENPMAEDGSTLSEIMRATQRAQQAFNRDAAI